ncbi:unnamed protein product, partial [Arctogadus glacialis]
MEKKRKGGTEKLGKRQALEANAEKCGKISNMFAATAGAGPSSPPPPPTTVEIAAAETEQDAGGGVEEGNEWRPRPRSATGGGGAGQGSGEEIGSLFPLSGTVAGLLVEPPSTEEES